MESRGTTNIEVALSSTTPVERAMASPACSSQKSSRALQPDPRHGRGEDTGLGHCRGCGVGLTTSCPAGSTAKSAEDNGGGEGCRCLPQVAQRDGDVAQQESEFPLPFLPTPTNQCLAPLALHKPPSSTRVQSQPKGGVCGGTDKSSSPCVSTLEGKGTTLNSLSPPTPVDNRRRPGGVQSIILLFIYSNLVANQFQ